MDMSDFFPKKGRVASTALNVRGLGNASYLNTGLFLLFI